MEESAAGVIGVVEAQFFDLVIPAFPNHHGGASLPKFVVVNQDD